jgi:protein-disulfide isomerase
MHEQACDAARAALCANQQGKFWPYHDLLFDQQPNFSREQLSSYAKKIGLNTQTFLTCMDSEETKSKILADIEVGKNIQLEGTPTIFINGRLMKDWLNPVMLNLIIEEELKKTKNQQAASQK